MSSSFLEKGVAIAAAMDGIGLALNRQGPISGERLGQALELRQDLSAADLVSDVLGAAVGFGHAEDKKLK